MIVRGDSTVAVHPLFQEEDGGSIPTSPLQLRFHAIDKRLARDLVFRWHSRLPEISTWQTCNTCFGATYDGRWFASAMWGHPVAREFNGRHYIELRRFAIANEAPKNTASRMLGWMLKQIRGKQLFVKAISYQDTEVHDGTIYKATGWKRAAEKKNIGTGWQTRNRPAMQTASNKIRWEIDFCPSVVGEHDETISTTNMELWATV